MKKYPFARLLLKMLVILASLTALVALGQFIHGGSIIFRLSSDIVKIKGDSKVFDTALLVAQMETTINAVRSVSPALNFPPPSLGRIPAETRASLNHQTLMELQDVLGDYREDVGQLKEEYLAVFDNNIAMLLSAALDRLEQLESEGKPRASPKIQTKSITLYEQAYTTAADLEELREISRFLSDQISYYTPSDTALNAAKSANKNITAAYVLYRKEYEESLKRIQQNKAMVFGELVEKSSTRPQAEILGEFIKNLSYIQSKSNEILIQNWSIDRTIEAFSARIDEYSSKIAEKNQARNLVAANTLKSVLLTVGIAVLILVVRDFFAAAIDIAHNTAKMREYLQGMEVRYDDQPDDA